MFGLGGDNVDALQELRLLWTSLRGHIYSESLWEPGVFV